MLDEVNMKCERSRKNSASGVEGFRLISPNHGFQIGGYYTEMHFEFDDHNGCMEWVIHSDGEFPTEDRKQMIELHICDFRQIESWVKVWGDYLREQGVVDNEEDE